MHNLNHLAEGLKAPHTPRDALIGQKLARDGLQEVNQHGSSAHIGIGLDGQMVIYSKNGRAIALAALASRLETNALSL
jgi:hypothetical protein